MYHGREWSGITPENFMPHTDAYIRWYNERRIKLSLGAVSPEMLQNVPSETRHRTIKLSKKTSASSFLLS